MRADSDAEGEKDRKQWVRRRTGKRGLVGEGLLFTILLCHHRWCHCGRSSVGWEGEEVVLTSSSSQRSARVCYHVLHNCDAAKRLSERRLHSTGFTPHVGENKEHKNAQKGGPGWGARGLLEDVRKDGEQRRNSSAAVSGYVILL